MSGACRLAHDQLHQGDCLELLPRIESGSIDMVFADPPYNTKKYPVTDEEKKAGYDPLSAATLFLAGLRASASNPCGTAAPVFDGRRRYNIQNEEAQRQTIVSIYRRNGDHALRVLCEAMIEYDEMFSLWREHHIRMAQRMIGSKPGTGQQLVETTYGKSGPMGTHGVDYLVQTLTKKFFPVLWTARTEM